MDKKETVGCDYLSVYFVCIIYRSSLFIWLSLPLSLSQSRHIVAAIRCYVNVVCHTLMQYPLLWSHVLTDSLFWHQHGMHKQTCIHKHIHSHVVFAPTMNTGQSWAAYLCVTKLWLQHQHIFSNTARCAEKKYPNMSGIQWQLLTMRTHKKLSPKMFDPSLTKVWLSYSMISNSIELHFSRGIEQIKEIKQKRIYLTIICLTL